MKQQSYQLWITGGIFLFCLATTSPLQAQTDTGIVPDPTPPGDTGIVPDPTPPGDTGIVPDPILPTNIVPDATLPVNSAVQSESNNTIITGGTTAGRNLFHSFQEFNIDEGQKVNFISPSTFIQNILARVTGSNPSKIMGTLGTSGLSEPNLFLLNPNGIIFGPNASLNVGGSFVATTANSIQFGNQGFFSASVPNAPGLLTVNPSALLFNQIAAKSISNESLQYFPHLKVHDGQSLLLVGGNVNLNGGSLTALGGRVELGGVAGDGQAVLNVNGSNLRLSYPAQVQRANVTITNGAKVNVSAGSSSIIANSAHNLAGINSVSAKGGGSIAINSHDLDVNNAELNASTSGQGKAGGVFVQTDNTVSLSNSSIKTDTFGGQEDSGTIKVKAGSVSLTGGTRLSSSTYGEGKAGGVFVQANNGVSLDNSSIVTGAASETNPVGTSGDINIQAEALSLTNAARLSTSTSGKAGSAGKVIINTQDTVTLTNSSIISKTFGQENGGDISIQTGILSLTDGAQLFTSTSGQGNGGNIQINAPNSVSVSGVDPNPLGTNDQLLTTPSGLFTTTEPGASGKGGDITVTTGSLRVLDQAVLSAITRNTFRGGNITISTNIPLEVANGGQILTNAVSGGTAGNILVNGTVSSNITGSNPPGVEPPGVEPPGVEPPGVEPPGVEPPGVEPAPVEPPAVEPAPVEPPAVEHPPAPDNSNGAGASDKEKKEKNPTIERNDGIGKPPENPSNTSDIDDGISDIDDGITVAGFNGLDNQGTLTVDLARLIEQSCPVGRGAAASKFVMTGRGGSPPSPREALESEPPLVDLGTPIQRQENRASAAIPINPTSSYPASLVEAQGWVLSGKGEVVLTAQAATVTPYNPWLKPVECHATKT